MLEHGMCIENEKSGLFTKKQKKISILILMTIVTITLSIKLVNAYVQVEPFEPQHIDEGEIPNLGPYRNPVPLEFRCYLEEGHKYHIFLVGDWVTNSSDATDYDIEVRNPSNVVVSINTESAGLPEQVANDAKHQFFIPSQTGDYRFLIYNDPEDSAPNRADPADFLIIEHIEMNTVYKKELFGKPNVGAEYPSGYKIGYEFNTTEPEFLLYIKVPDPVPAEGISGLDMYEARVYPMANHENDIGYSIQDVGVPIGERLYEEGVSGNYGGFNTEIDGFRFPDLRISCESAGVDMRKVMSIVEVNTSGNIYYYLVLLAEYFEGEIEFYLKTDYRAVNLTLVDSPEVGYTGDTTLIKVEAESAADIDSMWIEYTTDEWKSSDSVELSDKTDYWLAALPSFELHNEVEYRVHAVDEIDNRGLIEGSFTVMNKVEIDFGVSGSVIQGGQTVKITGAATRPSINLKLNVEHGGSTNSINIQTDGDGVFTYDYKPTKIGEYDVTLSYAGDEDYHSAVSREKSFRVDKRKLEVETEIETDTVKVERSMTISGRIIPPVSDLEVEFIFVTPETSFTETVFSDRSGMFSVSIVPEVVGNWDMLPQLKVSELYDASQGDMITFAVNKLTPIDIIEYQAMKFLEPPLLYIPIALVVILVAVIVQRTGLIDRIRGYEEDDEEEYEDEETEEESNGGAAAYRRRSERN